MHHLHRQQRPSEPVDSAIKDNNLVVAAILSGNRNFEGRISPSVKASYLASPPLVVAYAIAGRIDIDLTKDPIGASPDGAAVYLKDIWPASGEIRETMQRAVTAEAFKSLYARVFDGDDAWRSLPVPTGDLYEWDSSSTYIQEPPFFDDVLRIRIRRLPSANRYHARVLVMVGDSVTTDHIRPQVIRPTVRRVNLIDRGISQKDFNTRRAAQTRSHDARTFANIRLKNLLVEGTDGGTQRRTANKCRSTTRPCDIKRKARRFILAGRNTVPDRPGLGRWKPASGRPGGDCGKLREIHRSNLVGWVSCLVAGPSVRR